MEQKHFSWSKVTKAIQRSEIALTIGYNWRYWATKKIFSSQLKLALSATRTLSQPCPMKWFGFGSIRANLYFLPCAMTSHGFHFYRCNTLPHFTATFHWINAALRLVSTQKYLITLAVDECRACVWYQNFSLLFFCKFFVVVRIVSQFLWGRGAAAPPLFQRVKKKSDKGK